jgi:hypothetical protein
MSADVATDAPEVPGYALGQRIGNGGSGTVWAATRRRDGARVAVKVVPVGTGGRAESAAREIAVLARADVDGLVGFHEAVGLAGEPPAVALVLDQVGGGSLEGVVRARGHLSVGESVTILAPVARALAGLHGRGVVHGDVTPGNVLLERTGRPLLADLGVATLAGEVPGQLYGTTGFVAPEVLDRGLVTSAADAYAVGALAWWCVTGSAPEPVALRRPLEELAPGLPDAWADVTLRALHGDPDLRPTAAELALAYYDSAPCEPLRLVVGSDETSLLTQRLRQPGAATGATPGPRRGAREPRRVAALATVALLVMGLGTAGLMASGRLPTPAWVDRGPDKAVGHAGTTTARAVERRDVATDPGAPQRDPHALMVALATLRAEVMVSGSVPGLARLDAPGSPALAQDTAVLRELAESGRSWQGVALQVTSARTVSHSAGRATLDADVGTAAYRVVDAAGRAERHAAVAGGPLRFELVWSAGRWRVESIADTAG